ncbi:ATP-dependent protease La [Thermobaculum terrenum ATCC BAA-798]|uniref:Lon protease n=1 Tax=Thermobaculum terrenum (strain ATCC BAA-798 / CCMEE 7001 / YNP1) TaxID=525904 RepID=D1CBY4_THET1|nr:endopeptidase La [Thermobaculum terrenum]ACZ42299.1 ATP-dependent protease La [Thermobaculum terrenum ATCC BAA-798]
MYAQSADVYPLLPLKRTVILPGTESKLTIGRPKSLEAAEWAIARDCLLVTSAQRNGDEDDPSPEGLNRIGTLVRLRHWERLPEGLMQVVVVGLKRVSLHRVEVSEKGYRALVSPVEEPETTSSVERLMIDHVVDLYAQHVESKGKSPSDARNELEAFSSASELADYLGNILITDWQERQKFLSILHPMDRLERLAIMLTGSSQIEELESRIRARVRQQIDKSQREYYLREQLKVIHDELSGEGGNEIQALRDKVESSNLPDEVREKALREINRLERTPSTSPESGVIRTYLDWILALPWSHSTEDNYDIRRTEQILDEDHYGLEKVKERILEFLAVRELTSKSGSKPKTPILCLVGPPGVGKTSLGQSIARALGRSFVRISLGGVRDEAEIRGHRRTYVGALPGRIIHGLRQAKTNNPVMLLDEIDKMSADYKGDPSAAMLEVLDPEQNKTFVDHYMELPFDLSNVLFIATANTLDTIPRPLLDRMEVIQIGGYTEDEKVQIARRYLLPKQIQSHGLQPHYIEISDKMLRHIVRFYTREAGVRNLERQLGAICRKAARQIVSGRTSRIRVTTHLLQEYLGPPRKIQDMRNASDQVGVAIGMAWTELGGVLLPVEVATLPGKGQLIITGRLGDVMQESAKAALSYARSRAKELNIPENFQETTDWHIHLPEGAVPKDGPSAGITMATAMISALTHRPVRSDVAMTGEITLRGRVLPIGGLKEKVLAAHQSGIRCIIAPKDNEPDLNLIPKNVQRDLKFYWVESMDEVLKIALAPRAENSDSPIDLPTETSSYDLSVQSKSS